MRLSLEIELENEKFPKDKNRVILSILKKALEDYDKEYYDKLYADPSRKDFTFSMYMGRGCEFLRDEIVIPDKKIILNFSFYEPYDGLMFYNALVGFRGKKHPIAENSAAVKNIWVRNEKPILLENVVFKALSPVVVRDHNGDNKKTWYYSLNEQKGREIFIRNLECQIVDKFGDAAKYDLKDMEFEFKSKDVRVKNYSIDILSNIAIMKVSAKQYILDYIYKAGVGSKRSMGFGMLEIV